MSDMTQKIAELENEILELKEVNSKFESRILRLEQNSHVSESNFHGNQSRIRTQNCWEFKKCGREPGGTKVADLGVCPATEIEKLEGINRGEKGGRACWALVGTLCGGKVQGIFAEKIITCSDCEFYKLVQHQEGRDFRHALPSKE